MDHDRGRDFRKKKFNTREKEEKQMKRPIILLKSKDSPNKPEESQSVPQTILLKTRDGEKRAVSPQASTSRPGKESDPSPVYHLAPRITAPDLSSLLPSSPEMKSCIKLISPETLAVSDALMDYLTDSTDFVVIGCIGFPGSGKSTVMSRLVYPGRNDPLMFPVSSEPENLLPGTEGIDAFVTKDRLILLDSESILSCCFMNKRNEDDPENEIEILSLQYAALLLSVCHILIVVHDSAPDAELVRFLLAAEMFKPSVTPQPDEDPSIDYFPYVVFLHNKADSTIFNHNKIKTVQEYYKISLKHSQLPISSGIGVANGTILRSLNPDLCGEPLNLFVLPHYCVSDINRGFIQNIQFEDLIKKYRLQLLSLPPISLTHTLLTEKNWWHYTQKIWEDIKKSTFFPEYGRLLPTQASAKTELGNT